MAKTYASFTHRVRAASSPPLQVALSQVPSGTSQLWTPGGNSWTANTRLVYFGWNCNFYADLANDALYFFMKSNQTGGDGEGAVHKYTISTGIWTEIWRGYPATGSNDRNNMGHPYNAWAHSFAENKQYWLSTSGSNLRKLPAGASAAWDVITSVVSNPPFASTNAQGQFPYGLGLLENMVGSTEGLIVLTVNRAFSVDKDGTDAVQIWAKEPGQTWYHPTIGHWTGASVKSVFMSTNGYAKSNGVYNNSSARAVNEVPIYRISTNGTRNPTVARLQDAPSANIGSNGNTYDRLCGYGDDLLLFEGNGTGVWRWSAVTSQWSAGPVGTHNFKSGVGQTFSICSIPQYGGVVGMASTTTATAKTNNASVNMFLYRV